ncbi:mitochondrial ribosomal subunit protein [Rhodotorula toruloides]|uniref:Mitochondrial ribosomal subunit protein n=1 Tax=Rhodotorula toruloides TaxID=5286 RepID=A0A511KH70_RHOTO|nr:mitochondrial ribosomal subunit protein [Rhodotorula toruloides]
MRPTLLRAHQQGPQKIPYSIENVLNIFKKGARAGSSELSVLDWDHPIHKQPYDFGDFSKPTIMKMEKQRELLHYLRLEQHQFKDLVAYRKKFVPPTKDQVIAVRHQHYQGEEHPSSRRISIRVPVSALPLASPEAVHKFKLLAGARWHPPLPDSLKHPHEVKAWKVAQGEKDEGVFEMSCEVFPYDRMNEKWCSDTLEKLLKEANDLKKETFADIPIDTRFRRKRLMKNGKLRRNITFANYPKEWLPAQAQPEAPAQAKVQA